MWVEIRSSLIKGKEKKQRPHRSKRRRQLFSASYQQAMLTRVLGSRTSTLSWRHNFFICPLPRVLFLSMTSQGSGISLSQARSSPLPLRELHHSPASTEQSHRPQWEHGHWRFGGHWDGRWPSVAESELTLYHTLTQNLSVRCGRILFLDEKGKYFHHVNLQQDLACSLKTQMGVSWE